MAVTDYLGHRDHDLWYQKLKSLGSDLGSAVKGFRQSVTDKTEDKGAEDAAQPTAESTVQQNESTETQQTEAKEKV